jgi:hypothetical protein
MVLKCPYEKPQVMLLGNVTELTHAAGSGPLLDANFPIGTKKGDLTFCDYCS